MITLLQDSMPLVETRGYPQGVTTTSQYPIAPTGHFMHPPEQEVYKGKGIIHLEERYPWRAGADFP